jgi:hypothetical protein
VGCIAIFVQNFQNVSNNKKKRNTGYPTHLQTDFVKENKSAQVRVEVLFGDNQVATVYEETFP